VIYKTLLASDTLFQAVQAIEFSEIRTVVVLDEENKLLGTITDGDIRRRLLKGGNLQDSVTSAMNSTPVSAKPGSSSELLAELMKHKNVLTIPIVTDENHFIELVHLKDLNKTRNVSLPKSSDYEFAVIMAGGEGSRLKPITNKIPKPMVEIGGMPLLERQIISLSECGIKKIYISVNYLANQIEDYFENGSRYNTEIVYLRESNKMGTAGALTLINETPKNPILLLNGDVFTNSIFNSLLEYHNQSNVELTVATTNYTIDVPYGVLQMDKGDVKGIVEKPTQNFLCNAGIYCISPIAFKLIAKFKIINITELFKILIEEKLKIAAFPIHEYWIDIGTPEDLDKARDIFKNNFLLS
jgi:dTDP-glucose pyrophosphorylase/predicted transcriptional regulator